MTQERDIKLTFTQLDEATGATVKKTLTFGYIKQNIQVQEVIDLGRTILNSNCYDFIELVAASIVETSTTKIDLN